MENKLTRKYGPLTAMCMVVGTVIGSGIFFRNEAILAAIGGNMWIGIAAWAIGGFITLSAAYVFGILSTHHEKVGGLVDYSEVLIGSRYGYLFGWFLASMFYPAMTGILAWVSARFTVILFGWDVSLGINPGFSGHTFMLALFYVVAVFAMNTLGPKLAGKFQVSTTFIKLVPLVLMGVAGTASGLINGTTLANLNTAYIPEVTGNPFLIALVATVFAYLGWDAVISINSEVKNSKRNVPIALVGGLLIIITVYVLYFIGIFSSAPLENIAGPGGVLYAFVSMFGSAAGTILFVFIVISCLGTLNGLTVCNQRALYIVSMRGKGIKPELLSQVDKGTNAPYNSASLALLFCVAWIVAHGANFAGWYGDFFFDIPGLIPIAFQLFLIPIYIRTIITQKQLGAFNRFIAPSVATLGAAFLLYAAADSQGWHRISRFLVLFIVIMIIGALLLLRKDNKQK